jgi:hypothetical protein
MLRTNLATRPFYNERLIHVLLGVGLVLVAAFTAFNVSRLLSLSRQQAAFTDAASRDEGRAADLRGRAAAIRRGIDPKALARVTQAAIEANRLIDARTFSWTALFNDIEATLPPTVMLSSVTPSVSDQREGVQVRFMVVGRTVDAIDTFIERLEETGRFRDVIASSEQVTEEGLYETTIEGAYLQGVAPANGSDAPAAAAPARGTPPPPASTGGTR